MKKRLKVLALCLSLAIFAALPLSACSQSSGDTDGPNDTVHYTVTFSAGDVGNDEVTGMPAAASVQSGQKVARPAAEPSREGYAFDDWYTAAAGGEAFDFDSAITQNTTIYAQWTPEQTPAATVTVAFDGNAGTDEVTGMPAAASVEIGQKAARPSTEPSREGYLFRGWFSSDQGGQVFDFDAAITENTTVYAQWWKMMTPAAENPVRVACVGDSLTEGGYPEVLQSVLGECYEVENFGRSGSTVAGFPKDNAAYSTTTAHKNSLSFDPDIVLMMLGTNDAQDWANAQDIFEDKLIELIEEYQDQNPEVTVIFMTAPVVLGDNKFDIDKDDLDTYIVLLQREIAAKMGVKLLDVREAFLAAEDRYEELYTKNDGSVDNVHFGAAGNQFLANLAANAVLDLCGDYTVVFSAGDIGKDTVTGMPAAAALMSGQKATRPAADPVREGYAFEGWFTQETGGKEFDFDAPVTEDTTVYAQWSLIVPDEKTDADLVLFIGQSNMGGRGAAELATQTKAGHAYEFRAMSDPTQLYPVREPFGADENNPESGINEKDKTGSMVSAFCESYYAQTNTPIVAVSCSKGGEAISFFDTDGKPYEDAVARMNLAKEFLTENEDTTNLVLRNVFVVWLQGEWDGNAGTSAQDYTAALDRIVQGFKTDIGADQFFVIPIGAYNGSDAARNAAYTVIREAQIEYCEDNPDATVISTQLYDLYEEGLMKDSYHFFQSGYNMVGTDAGTNMAYFVETGEKPVCKDASECSTPLKKGGAWLEENGQVVISAEAALEQTEYASYHSGSVSGDVWGAWDGWLTGMHNLIDAGKQWSVTDAVNSAPYLQYKINIQTAGTYYVYLMITSPSGGSNTVHVGIDGTAIDCGAPTSYGTGRWQYNTAWKFDLTPGEHTVTVYVREDGVTVNQIALKQSYDTWTIATWQGFMLEESDRELLTIS